MNTQVFRNLNQTGAILGLVALYFFVVSFLAFLTFAIDKRRSMRGEWRISEATLLLLAFIGGAFGARLGQSLFRHKTQKEPFRSRLAMLTYLNIFYYFIALPAILAIR